MGARKESPRELNNANATDHGAGIAGASTVAEQVFAVQAMVRLVRTPRRAKRDSFAHVPIQPKNMLCFEAHQGEQLNSSLQTYLAKQGCQLLKIGGPTRLRRRL